MAVRIAVVGSGAIGSPIGGLLSAAGHDVVIFDQWAAHVEAMKTAELRITFGVRGADNRSDIRVSVSACHLYEAAALRKMFDIVFLASKSYDSRWLAQFIEPYMTRHGVLVSVQNSLNDEWIAPIVGRDRDIGCVLTAGGGELLGPGHVWRDLLENRFVIGELDGKLTERVRQVADILGAAAEVTTTANITGAKWTKLVKTCMASPLAGLTGRLSRDLRGDPYCRHAAILLGIEAIKVGIALGYKMEPIRADLSIEEVLDAPDLLLERVTPAPAVGEEARNFISQDLAKGRRTEIDYINGLVCQKGRSAGIPTPLNRKAVELIHDMEHGTLAPDPRNIQLLVSP